MSTDTTQDGVTPEPVSTTSADGNSAAHQQRQFFGQPWGLANLFGVEMWERFSFYGMQSILAYYLYYSVTDGGLGMDQTAALSIIGAYGGFVYVTSLIASFVADRLIGSERTLFYAAVTVMAGHIALALIPGYVGLSIGLVLIGLGSGGVKTAAQVVLGQLYSRTDTRRDAGFSIFYMGVNIGGLFGPLLTGWIWGMQGFHWGFGLAAIGMALGLIQYVLMRKSTIGAAGHAVPNPLPKKQYLPWALGAVVVVAVVIALIGTGIIRLEWLSTITAAIAFIAAVVLLSQMYTSPLTSPEEKSRLLGFIPMFVGGVLFFAIFQSQFTVLAVYADQRLNLNFLGLELTPNQVQSFNPLFIIIFSGVFAALWTRLGKRQWSTPVKFGVANIIIGASLFFFLPYAGGGENSTPMLVIIWILFLFTMGELLLSPVGNSLATKVAPQAFQSRMFAVWLMAVSMGTSLSGTLGGFYNPEDAGAERTFFVTVGIAAIVLGLVTIALKRWVLKKFVDVR
ncbi:peptide MFS transporter [Corynebacterium halotolerans]|uniref:Tripeptide transporter n=1 Tax=Corynebacterium halotolerans YIM 70093 = DSM 44683 TaxID=1121362 RepID=M1NNP7_9CORY|nr:peptide MFS transporter [Corynebacterium halotolerans]AGF71112.1 tripeptide transporter [Corynebacterium halotolerans YIM 70093 = DSM 44683]